MYFRDMGNQAKNADKVYYNEDVNYNELETPETEEGVCDEDDGIQNMNAVLEQYLTDMVMKMSDAVREQYLQSDEFKALCEAGVVGRRSIVKFNRNDDLTRRIHLAAIQKARESGDADWEALRKNRVQEKKLLDKIYKKYANKVRGDAVKAQRRLIKLSPKAFDFSTPIR